MPFSLSLQGPIEIKAPAGASIDDWLSIAKPEVRSRIEKYSGGEIRFNLLAITKDESYSVETEILKLRHLRQRVNIKLVSLGEDLELDDEVDDDDAPEGVTAFEDLSDDVDELKKMATESESKISTLKTSIQSALDKKAQWKKENERRRHDYVPFLLAALKCLAKKGTLVDPCFQKGKEKAAKDFEKRKAEEEAKKAVAAK